jgi:hypothetical protein
MIIFEPVKIRLTSISSIILKHAESLLDADSLQIFQQQLQGFIDSLKLPNYKQPKDIFVLQGHPDRIELFKRDGSDSMVYLTSFKEAGATPKVEVQSNEFKPYTLDDFAFWKVPLHCFMCNEKCTTDTNLVSGFFDADLNVYVHDYKECKNKFYEYKNTTKFKYMISEVPIPNASAHIFIDKIKKAGTVRPTIEFLNIQLNFEQIEKFYNSHINNNFSKDEPFFKDGIYLDVKSFEFCSTASDGSTLKCKCEECDKPILANLGGYFQAWLRHDGGNNNNNFGVLCNDCAKSAYYTKFDFKKTNNAKINDVEPIEKTPIFEPTTPVLELKQKKQIAIKPSELPSVKAMQKNNSKSINNSYAGGKNASGVYQFLINHVPPVKCIVSGFLGHCGLLKNIKPAKLMVGIDKDKLVTDRWNKEDLGIKLITGDFLNNLDWVNPKQFGETLVFLDPPYLDETRASQGKLYNYEFQTAEQHKTLLEKAVRFPCYVMITAYENELYNHYLDGKNGFTKYYFNGQTRAGRKQECMYINYDVPTQLHDYRYQGTDYRERWNNKKLIERTISQLKDMPALRRNMVIDAILNYQF